MSDKKLVEYVKRFLASRPSGTMTAEELAADFAAQLRRGCHQDLLRLIERVRAGTPKEVTGKSALRTLATALGDVEGIEAWGLPDCACGKPDCVLLRHRHGNHASKNGGWVGTT